MKQKIFSRTLSILMAVIMIVTAMPLVNVGSVSSDDVDESDYIFTASEIYDITKEGVWGDKYGFQGFDDVNIYSKNQVEYVSLLSEGGAGIQEAYFHLFTYEHAVKPIVAIKYRSTNATTIMEIYTDSVDKKPDGNSAVGFNVTVDGEWHLATVDLATSITDYNGETANFFRLDFMNATNLPENAYVDFAYIGFFDTVEAAETYDATASFEPVYIDPESAYTESDLMYWSALDMINGMGQGSDKNYNERGGNSISGVDTIKWGGETFSNNYLVISGWSVVDGGVSKYVWSADYGKTWNDTTFYRGSLGSVANNHAYVTTAQSRLGGVTLSENSGVKSGYQCGVGLGVNCAGIAADLSAYVGKSIDVTFAAVPLKDTSTLCVLDYIEDVFVGEREDIVFNKTDFDDDNHNIIVNANGLANGVDAYYRNENVQRDAYTVENMITRINFDLTTGGESKVASITNKSGVSYIEDTMSVFVRMTDGKTYTASNYVMSPRPNIYRHGYYYYETHILDNDFINSCTLENELALDMGGFLNYNQYCSTQPTLTDGVVSFTLTNSIDPYIYNSSLSYVADDYNCITFSVRSDTASSLDILFLNKGSAYSLSKAKNRIQLKNDGEWHTYTVPTYSMIQLGYTGEIAGLRFDFDGLCDTDVEIKDIKLQNYSFDSVPLTVDRVMHTYSDKLHQELHVVAYENTTDIAAIGMITEIAENTVAKIIVKDKSGIHSSLDGVDWQSTEYIGFDIINVGVFGYIVPADGESGGITVSLEDGVYTIVQEHTPDDGVINAPQSDTSNDFRMGQRIYADSNHTFDSFMIEAEQERNPLTAENIIIDINDTPRAKFKCYDSIRGAYYFILSGASNFNAPYYNSPNMHYELSFGIKGDGQERNFYVFAHASTGSLESAALLDVNDMMLPIPIEVCKNFSEGEEPIYNCGDISYGDTIFPMTVGGEESKYLTLLNLCQNWGQFPLKQISSIGYYVPYYHLSTGVTETNCISQYSSRAKNYGLLPDHRGMSAPFWSSQPQHYNVGHHTFLTYTDSEGKFVGNEYLSADINSYGLTYADINLNYISDDGKISVSLNHMEMPQTDENRSYYEITYKVLESVTIDNFRRDFSIYSVFGASYYKYLGYLDASSNCTFAEMQAVGEEARYHTLGKYYPYFDLYYMEGITAGYGNLAFLIESSDITIGGVKNTANFAVKEQNQSVSLTLDIDKTVTLEEGDSIKIKAIIMPWGGGWKKSDVVDFDESLYSTDKVEISNGDIMYHVNNDQSVRKVRLDSLINKFKATAVSDCTVDTTATFLPVVETTNGKQASFTISGGNEHNAQKHDIVNVTVIVKGFNTLTVPKFEELIDGDWVEFTVSSANTPDKSGNSHSYDGYSVTYDNGKYDYSFVAAMSDGNERTFRVTVGEAPTRGFDYVLGDDGVSLMISGIGNVTDATLVFPESYGGLPVTGVASGSFVGRGVKTLTIHNGIINIAPNNAFAGDFSGVTVYIDEENPNYRAEDNKIYHKESGKLVWGGSAFGDSNGDNAVSSRDVVNLRNYFADYDYENDAPEFAVYSGADVNGDGETDTADLTCLRKYFANYDYDTDTPAFELGQSN